VLLGYEMAEPDRSSQVDRKNLWDEPCSVTTRAVVEGWWQLLVGSAPKLGHDAADV
jgi:hypothetical protein